jgi:uncharacterized membrane protein (DUF4010 family)
MLSVQTAPVEAPNPLLGFGIALALGALIGVERERKKRAGELSTGGLRTFALLAEAGAIAAWLALILESPWIFAAGGALVTAIVLAGYFMEVRARPESIGLTTEIAGLVTYLLGGAVLFGEPELAAALAIATTAVLAFKEPLHGLVERIGREDLEAGLKLLLATFVVLPVLPDRAVDPLGVLNPYTMWWLVILISALSFLGYVATRLLGTERGLVVTGLAGGLVSSTAVTLGFARQSRERAHEPPAALAAGLLLAWAVMFARVGVAVALVHRPLLARLTVPLGAMGGATLALALLFALRGPRTTAAARSPDVRLKNPFSLLASVRFALLFAAVLLVVELARRYTHPNGLYAVAALAGLTDVDAITLSMAELAAGGGPANIAAGSIAVAALANTLVKCGLVFGLGSPELRRRVALATGLILASGAAAVALA